MRRREEEGTKRTGRGVVRALPSPVLAGAHSQDEILPVVQGYPNSTTLALVDDTNNLELFLFHVRVVLFFHHGDLFDPKWTLLSAVVGRGCQVILGVCREHTHGQRRYRTEDSAIGVSRALLQPNVSERVGIRGICNLRVGGSGD